MDAIPLTPGWDDLALRLALAAAAGALIGFDRDERGRPAGLRTTLLVCLAAAVAMVLANLLLPSAQRAAGSSYTFDVMRLPLGILSGMGFLGAGAILRRSDIVIGLTTAATLWMVTVIGLAFGSGAITLGIVATGATLVVLWAMKRVEGLMKRERRASLILVTAEGPSRREICEHIAGAGLRITGEAVTYRNEGADEGPVCETQFDVLWHARRDVEPPDFVRALAQLGGVRKVQWLPQGVSTS